MADVHGNYYYMVEGSPHMWLMCMVITTIYGGGEPSHVQLMCTVYTPIQWRGALTCGSCVVIIVHGSYKNMVEGTPHMWAINVHANY